mgnify:CR=1 FL=1
MKTYITIITLAIGTISFAQQSNESMDIGGVNRTYVQYLPTGFNPSTESLPVVFCLHGLGDVSTNMANIGFNNMADTARFIAIYPQGIANSFGQTSWANGTSFLSSTADDITFFNLMINDLILNKNADPTRIYSSGFSMGGIMSHKLACVLNDRIAAIGTMSGTMSTDDFTNCVPSYATPVMHVHGTADGTVPYAGSPLPSLELVEPTIDFWRNVHGCASTADSTQLPNIASDGYTVDRFIYQGCSPQGSVELWRVNGADHEYFYRPVNDFTEALEIWHFLRKWSHSNPATADISSLSKNELNIYPNPSNGTFTIVSPEMGKASLISLTGKIIGSIQLQIGETECNFEGVSPGVYLIQQEKGQGLSQRIIIQ